MLQSSVSGGAGTFTVPLDASQNSVCFLQILLDRFMDV